MSLLIKHLKKEKQTLITHNIRFRTIGDISQLPENVQNLINETTEETKNHSGLQLTFALNYGGQQEIVDAFKVMQKKIQNNELKVEDISADSISKNLQSSFLPDPDLIVRTSNEKRISNFFLWQSAYSEFYFTEKFWPDFTPSDFDQALEAYSYRKRRFGSISSAPSQSHLDG